VSAPERTSNAARTPYAARDSGGADSGGAAGYGDMFVAESGASAETAQMRGMPGRAEYRVLGEALDTYISAERGSSLWLIDKHAAHERVHFDKLKAARGEAMTQTLMTTLVCDMSADDARILRESADILARLGFETESFGEDTVAVRAIPSDIDIADVPPALDEICEQLREGGLDEDARRDAVLRTVACKAAIKAGRRHDIRELEALAARVFSGEVRTCPHGRPVATELSKAALDKSFKRK
jgi:DNA mismatch repair protein MutL